MSECGGPAATRGHHEYQAEDFGTKARDTTPAERGLDGDDDSQGVARKAHG